MKTRSSQRILLIVGLSALLSGHALAAFGDNTAPAANALPPGSIPSSQSDGEKKAKDTDKQPPKPARTDKDSKPKPKKSSS
ncbi:hypothetical protein [Pseudomonas poae]|uniref:Uncharacterized protein n=1 Tax=Pseudomonas poae TaxID=200451 RepID=A0A2S9E2K2_9PSED|nr:hypothetical protein [Pseudomonas poae]PRA20826.1 hypothetical protein CQZ97_28590 [Pseudomonas poae]PRC09083.1 hypothetical protein CQZ99_27865 [Pseudomonas poae]